ncbi:Uncharacterised protein [Kluyvera cryocrescens]|uniref:Uncharacterized protein n=1 Tax=Kluyvera cryocrescens TaxID=580 RepID=A0A485B209_KLUCR|nr:Uncharacterised protein [Kluyvera cryocrescens]
MFLGDFTLQWAALANGWQQPGGDPRLNNNDRDTAGKHQPQHWFATGHAVAAFWGGAYDFVGSAATG